MKLKRIESCAEFRLLKKLYIEAFPPDERAPYWLLKMRALQKRADYWGILENENLIGMAYMLTNEKLAYLFYFAIEKRFRKKHCGTRAFRLLLEEYRGKKLFLALEDWTEECENKAQRIQRHEFYRKCGLEDLPYKIDEMSVSYLIMGNGAAIEPDEYKALIETHTGPVIKHFVKMRITKK